MKLKEFIEQKEQELLNTYKKVELTYTEDVMLGKNSCSQIFNSNQSNLEVEWYEPKLSELPEKYGTFLANGSLINFEVIPPRKRKPISKRFYFKWSE